MRAAGWNTKRLRSMPVRACRETLEVSGSFQSHRGRVDAMIERLRAAENRDVGAARRRSCQASPSKARLARIVHRRKGGKCGRCDRFPQMIPGFEQAGDLRPDRRSVRTIVFDGCQSNWPATRHFSVDVLKVEESHMPEVDENLRNLWHRGSGVEAPQHIRANMSVKRSLADENETSVMDAQLQNAIALPNAWSKMS